MVGRTLGITGTVSADTLAVTTGDVDLAGTIRATRAVSLVNSGVLAGMALGDEVGAAGFTLSNAELGRVHAPALDLDGDTGAVELGRIDLQAETGATSLAVRTTGDVTVTGAVSAPTSSRAVAIAGSGIRVLATVDRGVTGGGRLDLDGASLTLDADRIAVGQRAGFVDALFAGLTAQQVADRFVSNARSSLYNATLGGAAYADAPTLVRAKSMTVRYSQFALFQNTGAAVTGAGAVGTKAGVVLGAPGVEQALVLRSDQPVSNAFAMFGTIDGVANEAAAVVGEQILSTKVDGQDVIVIQNSRVNGCIIGTGGGCLTTPIGIPPINIFDASRLNVFVPADCEIAFDPVVGSNNEALFAGISALDVPTEGELQFDPNIGGNNEALFNGDQAGDQAQCPTDRSDQPCPPKEDRR